MGWRKQDVHSYGEDWQHLQAQKVGDVLSQNLQENPPQCPHAGFSGLRASQLSCNRPVRCTEVQPSYYPLEGMRASL